MLNINNLLKDFNQGFWSRKFTGWTLHPIPLVFFLMLMSEPVSI